MNKVAMESKSNEQLIEMYQKAAFEHQQATNNADPETANRAHDVLASAYRELRRRGIDAQSLLLPLLNSPELGIRSWAAAHALEFAPEKGVPVLESLSKEPPWIGFNAKMTLKVWKEGKLRFP